MNVNAPNQNNMLMPKKVIEHYSYGLQDIIGQGYSSIVYKGKDENTGEVVAIKVIDMKKITNEVQQFLLKNEINVMRKLENPNVLKLQDVYQTVNNTYIITEYCNQGDLTQLLQKYKAMQEAVAVKILKHILNGFRELVTKHVVHRDLKPANILIKDGIPKLADFGFAKDNDAPPCKFYYNVGTPMYMCPQALRKNEYSFKSDIWSIGALYYELLCGQTPWQAATEKELGQKISLQPVSFPPSVKISEESKDFIRRCLCVDESRRLGQHDIDNHPLFRTFVQQQPQPGLGVPGANPNINANVAATKKEIHPPQQLQQPTRPLPQQQQQQQLQQTGMTAPPSSATQIDVAVHQQHANHQAMQIEQIQPGPSVGLNSQNPVQLVKQGIPSQQQIGHVQQHQKDAVVNHHYYPQQQLQQQQQQTIHIVQQQPVQSYLPSNAMVEEVPPQPQSQPQTQPSSQPQVQQQSVQIVKNYSSHYDECQKENNQAYQVKYGTTQIQQSTQQLPLAQTQTQQQQQQLQQFTTAPNGINSDEVLKLKSQNQENIIQQKPEVQQIRKSPRKPIFQPIDNNMVGNGGGSSVSTMNNSPIKMSNITKVNGKSAMEIQSFVEQPNKPAHQTTAAAFYTASFTTNSSSASKSTNPEEYQQQPPPASLHNAFTPSNAMVNKSYCSSVDENTFAQNDRIILAQINFCRFLIRLCRLTEENCFLDTPYLKERVMFFILKNVMVKISKLKEFAERQSNHFNVIDVQSYYKSENFGKFQQVINEYHVKYSNYFEYYWVNVFSQTKAREELAKDVKFNAIFDKNFIELESFYIILQAFLRLTIREMSNIVQGLLPEEGEQLKPSIEGKIVLLDYLVTYFQLSQLIVDHFNDYTHFCQTSKIEQIAEGRPVKLTSTHYQQIKQKIQQLEI